MFSQDTTLKQKDRDQYLTYVVSIKGIAEETLDKEGAFLKSILFALDYTLWREGRINWVGMGIGRVGGATLAIASLRPTHVLSLLSTQLEMRVGSMCMVDLTLQ